MAASLHLFVPLGKLTVQRPGLKYTLNQWECFHPLYFRVEPEVTLIWSKLISAVVFMIA
jgi:hypothetical protein